MNQGAPGVTRNDPHERSGPYALVLATYAVLVGVGVLLVRRGHLRVPARIPPSDLVTMVLATHRLSKVLAKDPVTSHLRAPFTEFVGVEGPAELDERARNDSAMRHTIGELITCPFCLSQWIASAFVVGHLAAPGVTRLVATTSAVSAAGVAQIDAGDFAGSTRATVASIASDPGQFGPASCGIGRRTCCTHVDAVHSPDSAGRMAPMSDRSAPGSKTGNDVTMGTVLVIANQTIGNDELTAAVTERIGRGATAFHLVVPVSPTPPVIAAGLAAIETGAIAVVDLPDQRELAAERLAGGLAWFEHLGATATGELEPGDVVAAVVSLAQGGDVDEIVVSTLPSRLSRWLKQDLPHRLCKAVTVPVSVVTAHGEQPAR